MITNDQSRPIEPLGDLNMRRFGKLLAGLILAGTLAAGLPARAAETVEAARAPGRPTT